MTASLTPPDLLPSSGSTLHSGSRPHTAPQSSRTPPQLRTSPLAQRAKSVPTASPAGPKGPTFHGTQAEPSWKVSHTPEQGHRRTESSWKAPHGHIHSQNICLLAQVGISSLTGENPCSVLVCLGTMPLTVIGAQSAPIHKEPEQGCSVFNSQSCGCSRGSFR